jgi:hypothetical protein
MIYEFPGVPACRRGWHRALRINPVRGMEPWAFCVRGYCCFFRANFLLSNFSLSAAGGQDYSRSDVAMSASKQIRWGGPVLKMACRSQLTKSSG